MLRNDPWNLSPFLPRCFSSPKIYVSEYYASLGKKFYADETLRKNNT